MTLTKSKPTTQHEPVRSDSEVANGPVVGNRSVEEGGWLSPLNTSMAGLVLCTTDGLWRPIPECTAKSHWYMPMMIVRSTLDDIMT